MFLILEPFQTMAQLMRHILKSRENGLDLAFERYSFIFQTMFNIKYTYNV
jgi:hypothetical protein